MSELEKKLGKSQPQQTKTEIEINAKKYLVNNSRLSKFKIFNDGNVKHISLYFEKYILPLMLENYTIYDIEIETLTDFINMCSELSYFEYDINDEEIKELYSKIDFYKILCDVSNSMNKKRTGLSKFFVMTKEKEYKKRYETFKLEVQKYMSTRNIEIQFDILMDNIKNLVDYTPIIKQDFYNKNVILKICLMYNEIVRHKRRKEIRKEEEKKFTINLLKL